MIISCPNCLTKFNVPDKLVKPGQKAKCASCATVFTIPSDTLDNSQSEGNEDKRQAEKVLPENQSRVTESKVDNESLAKSAAHTTKDSAVNALEENKEAGLKNNDFLKNTAPNLPHAEATPNESPSGLDNTNLDYASNSEEPLGKTSSQSADAFENDPFSEANVDNVSDADDLFTSSENEEDDLFTATGHDADDFFAEGSFEVADQDLNSETENLQAGSGPEFIDEENTNNLSDVTLDSFAELSSGEESKDSDLADDLDDFFADSPIVNSTLDGLSDAFNSSPNQESSNKSKGSSSNIDISDFDDPLFKELMSVAETASLQVEKQDSLLDSFDVGDGKDDFHEDIDIEEEIQEGLGDTSNIGEELDSEVGVDASVEETLDDDGSAALHEDGATDRQDQKASDQLAGMLQSRNVGFSRGVQSHRGLKKGLYKKLLFVVILLVIICSALYFLLYSEGSKDTGKESLIVLTPEQQQLVKEFDITFQQFIIDNQNIGRIFVVNGLAQNNSNIAKANVKITVILLDDNSELISSKTFLAGANVPIESFDKDSAEMLNIKLNDVYNIYKNNSEVLPSEYIPFATYFIYPEIQPDKFIVLVSDAQNIE